MTAQVLALLTPFLAILSFLGVYLKLGGVGIHFKEAVESKMVPIARTHLSEIRPSNIQKTILSNGFHAGRRALIPKIKPPSPLPPLVLNAPPICYKIYLSWGVFNVRGKVGCKIRGRVF